MSYFFFNWLIIKLGIPSFTNIAAFPIEKIFLENAYNSNFNLFDTSPFYGNGLSEHRIGNFLKTIDNKLASQEFKEQLFGTKANAEFQADFKIVKNPDIVVNDNEVKLDQAGDTLKLYIDQIGYGNKICGTNHYNMQMKIVVESQEDYDAWMATQPTFAEVIKK